MCATKKFTPTGSYKLHDVRMYVGIMYAELMNAILTENVQQGNKEQGEDAAEKMQEDLMNVQFRPDVSSALMHLLSLSDCTTAVFYGMAESVFEHLSECYFNDFKYAVASIKQANTMNHHIVVRRSARIQRRKENQMAIYLGRQIKTQHYVASKRKTLYIASAAPASVVAASAKPASAAPAKAAPASAAPAKAAPASAAPASAAPASAAPASAAPASAAPASASEVVIYLAAAVEMEMQYEVIIS